MPSPWWRPAMAIFRSSENGAAWALTHGSTRAAQQVQTQQLALVSGLETGEDPS
jgi:hypothetical protein